MPTPHYPPRGGAYPPAWAIPSSGSGLNRAGREPEGAPPDLRTRQTLEAEIQRLQKELAHARQETEGRLRPRRPLDVVLISCALALCGGALLFALLALWRHG